jgi:hypothetical protein
MDAAPMTSPLAGTAENSTTSLSAIVGPEEFLNRFGHIPVFALDQGAVPHLLSS